eukprot:jgi/Chlat1/3838/Chrsp26S04062
MRFEAPSPHSASRLQSARCCEQGSQLRLGHKPVSSAKSSGLVKCEEGHLHVGATIRDCYTPLLGAARPTALTCGHHKGALTLVSYC